MVTYELYLLWYIPVELMSAAYYKMTVSGYVVTDEVVFLRCALLSSCLSRGEIDDHIRSCLLTKSFPFDAPDEVNVCRVQKGNVSDYTVTDEVLSLRCALSSSYLPRRK